MNGNTAQDATVQTIARPWLAARATFLVPIGLYLLTIGLLLASLDGHPPFPYAWEDYTALGLFPFLEHPTPALLQRNDGAMTDSGASPLVVLPIWLGFALGGINLLMLRLPLALLAGLAVPLLWAVGRRLSTPRVAATAGVLLALTPVFLLFGRTATNVGISLVPALLTTYVLIRVLQPPSSWLWLIALQVLLFLGQYAYSPIRFLWPISLVLLLGEALFQRAARRRLLVAFAVTAVVLPTLLALTGPVPAGRPWEVVKTYFAARGEQALAFTENPASINNFLRSGPAGPATPIAILGRLALQNAGDLTNLLLDRQTAPTIIDYWKSDGRLYSGVLVPFFLLGLVFTVATVRRVGSRVLLAGFAGFTLPLLLTSRVDVGRLIFALPFLCLMVALGYWTAADWLTARAFPAAGKVRQAVRYGGLVAVLAAVAVATWNDYRIDPPRSFEARIATAVRTTAAAEAPGARGGPVALVLGGAPDYGVELIKAAALRVLLDKDYDFVDLGTRQPSGMTAKDRRPPLYYGALLDRVGVPGAIPEACAVRYVVADTVVTQFRSATAALAPACGHELPYVVVPP